MKQAEKFYLISDTAKQVQVESHVLRYWEDELKLPIKRNEMGHRYYTEEDIARFKEIRNLKEQGFQLKAIRSMLLKGGLNPSVLMGEQTESPCVPEAPEIGEKGKRHVVMVNKGEFVPISEESREAKSYRLQQLLQNMITEAVRNNNQEVCEEMRANRQEEHYRQIDELIRTRNKRKAPKKKREKEKEPQEEKKEEVDELLKEENPEAADVKPRKKFLFGKKRSVS